MKVIDRIQAPVPKFFKTLRTIGLVLAGIGGSVIAVPVVLPAIVVSVAGYLTVAGGVLSAVSQMTSIVETAPDSGVNQEEVIHANQNPEDPG